MQPEKKMKQAKNLDSEECCMFIAILSIYYLLLLGAGFSGEI